jgi:c-di-GMP-binding flagellar brake protein YcgR
MPQPPNKHPPSELGQRITLLEQIIALLTSLLDEGTRLSIYLPGDPRPYPSALIRIDHKRGLLQLEELADAQDAERFRASPQMVIEGRLGGMRVHFNSQRSGATGADPYLLCLPKLMIFQQNRDNRRLRISKLSIPCNAVLQRDYLPIKGILLDISSNGAGIACKGVGRLRYNDLLHHCEFTLPDVGRISAQIKVRFLKEIPRKDLTRIGGQFTELPLAEQEMIDRQLQLLKAKG